ncbi:dentin sialophosphoprotein-like [Mytilus edulis]|uniref:dentin sialophosphoprotein-like n=1 Tax=Mytilus edulis TaxID=6550 RepID=UPI0039F0B4D8
MDFVRRRLSKGGSDDESSLSSSLSEGTSRFFSSMVAKKNGLMNNLSNKFDTVMKTSSSSDSFSSEEGIPKLTNRFSSADAYNYGTNVLYDSDQEHEQPNTKNSPTGHSNSGKKEIIQPRPLNMSFEEPLYSPTLKNDPQFKYNKTNSVDVKTSSNHVVQPNTTNHEIKADIHVPQSQCIGIKKVNNADVDPIRKQNGTVNGTSDSEKTNEQNESKNFKPPKLKRRSSTVDEMLFDDYKPPAEEEEEEKSEMVDESRDTVGEDLIPHTRKTIAVMADLISFDDDTEPDENENLSPKKRSPLQSVSSTNSSDINYFPGSVDSSEPEYGDYQNEMQRSESMGSEISWTSSYSVDSQPDEITLECMEFMKHFVDMIFDSSKEITQTEKAKFGELCQYSPGRLWFARYVNSQRVHSKMVTEQIFFRLVQYFAVVLFECNEAEDFSPAKSLMNMCFTFYCQIPCGKIIEKNFLYSFLCDQPIWQSLRFWNAAYFDAVQCERARRPMTTRNDARDDQKDDRLFQENITFGQLGTFSSNMRSFGLGKDLCLEFLRKQSTIGNLKPEQIRMLKDNIEKS